MRCPYCKGPLEQRPEFLPMSGKRLAILERVTQAGPAGLSKKVLVEEFFRDARSKTTIRTTIHYINKTISPLRIYFRGGVARLARDE